jgi:hypothetical protein
VERQGLVWQAWLGLAWQGTARRGNAGMDMTINEAAVSRQLDDFLKARGWRCTRTKAELSFYPNGRRGRQQESGHADYLCTRPLEPSHPIPNLPGRGDQFFREDKQPNAQPKKAHKAKQDAWTSDRRREGYLVCQIPYKCSDPLEWFENWYREHFGGV